MKFFVESQFAYCPLIWMFHRREINRKINKIQERSLRMVYANDTSTYSLKIFTQDLTVTLRV